MAIISLKFYQIISFRFLYVNTSTSGSVNVMLEQFTEVVWDLQLKITSNTTPP